MQYKRILTVQDISCFGQCSLTVALPIISACGQECCVLPSAVLSTHTGGFSGFTFRDLTDDMPAIEKHWIKENIHFDIFYTGYLGSARQIDLVRNIISSTKTEDAITIVDPAMADNGKLYTGFNDAFVEKMKVLCGCADILLPNITEASLLTGLEYKTSYDEHYIKTLLEALIKLGAKSAALTGVSYADDTTGVAVYENGEVKYYEHEKIPGGSHGTGDVYASAFTGCIARGKTLCESAKIAADYTLQCIKNTFGDELHKYGVKFETALPLLIKMIEL